MRKPLEISRCDSNIKDDFTETDYVVLNWIKLALGQVQCWPLGVQVQLPEIHLSSIFIYHLFAITYS
jgi:hypothetical protein